MLLEALASFPYAGKPLKPGDLFETEKDLDALILKTAGKAKDAGKKADKAKTLRLEAKVERVTEDDADPKGPGKRRRYMRRDMRAQD